MTEWITGDVIGVTHWTENLFSIKIRAAVSPFIAGQFTKLALDVEGKKIQRAYSYVNPPINSELEFYLVKVPMGKLSPKLHVLKHGDNIMITKESSGSFILNSIPECQILWMLSTGTAIGPYLSILQQGEGLTRFQNIVLVHAVRYASDLSYLPLMQQLEKLYDGKLRIQIVISREIISGTLTGRIPSLIENRKLEKAVNLIITAENSHVMLCGNPQMVHDTQQILQNTRRMRKHLKHKLGHITSEQYW